MATFAVHRTKLHRLSTIGLRLSSVILTSYVLQNNDAGDNVRFGEQRIAGKWRKSFAVSTNCQYGSEGRGRRPVMICSATYVIGLAGIIYEKRETGTGTSVSLALQVPE